jgi:hypothetical protein
MAYDSTGRSYAMIFGRDLEGLAFNAIEKKLGAARHYESGDAAEAEERIHYYLTKNKIFMTFTKGELDFGIIISYSKPKEKYTINNDYDLSTTDLGGIRLGITKREFYYGLPPNGIIDKTKPEYAETEFEGVKPDTFIEFDNKIHLTKEEMKEYGVDEHSDPRLLYSDEDISMSPKFLKGRLVQIMVDKSSQY